MSKQTLKLNYVIESVVKNYISYCLLEEEVTVVDYDSLIEGIGLSAWNSISSLPYEEMQYIFDEIVGTAHDLFEASNSIEFIKCNQNYQDKDGNWHEAFTELIVPAGWMN